MKARTQYGTEVACGRMARLGLGLAALGRPGYLNVGHGQELGADRSVQALRARTHEVLDFAYEQGVRDFDAARSYGLAEQFLGEWLRLHNPPGVTVSSKWGYVYTAGWEVAHDPPEVKHHDLSTFQRQLAETREQLGEWLALYQIHSATPRAACCATTHCCARCRRPTCRSASRSAARARRRRSTRRSPSSCSTPSKRPETCTSARPRARWREPPPAA